MEYLEAFLLVVGCIAGIIIAALVALALIVFIVDIFLSIAHSDNFMDI
jgi:hypothetical protein